MENFKSYGLRKVTMELHPGFTVICGRNGSGKSNTIDAILFVLGHLGSKMMRSENLSDVIFKGTKTIKKGAKKARVSIYFDNSDGGIPIDLREVEISREVDTSSR